MSLKEARRRDQIYDYPNMVKRIDQLISYLESIGIQADIKSHLEHDFYNAKDFYEKFLKDPSMASKGFEEARAALIGLTDLYYWIWSVKNSPDFHKLKPHLGLLTQAAPRINALTPMISKVTGKQDDKTNKFIELIVGMAAMKIGTDVSLDDPIRSSAGDNPDILFRYRGKRVAFACKTLRSDKTATIMNNLETAAEQIERADCDYGYLFINAMNISKAQEISSNVYPDIAIPRSYLMTHINQIYTEMRNENFDEIKALLIGKKIRPVIVTFIHAVTRLHALARLQGSANYVPALVSTSIKQTMATNLVIPGIDVSEDQKIFEGINDFIHHAI